MLNTIQVITVIFAISGFCLGLRTITDTDKILYFIRKWFLRTTETVKMYPATRDPLNMMKIIPASTTKEVNLTIPEWISKPLILCCACLSSFWGSIIFWLYILYINQDISYSIILQWIFVCIVSSYINELLWSIRNKLNS